MGITGGFGTTLDLERGTSRQWVMGHDGKKRWADNDAPCNPHEECSAEIERLDKERKYWLETAAGYAQELSGIKNDYQHPLTINGVTLDELEDAVKNGYQISTATQLDMIALVRRIMTPNAKLTGAAKVD